MKRKRSSSKPWTFPRVRPVQVLVVAASAFLAWHAAADAIVGITRVGNPERALAISHDDANALASLVDIELSRIGNKEQRHLSAKLLEDMAKRSLRGEALNVRAMRQVGMIGDLQRGSGFNSQTTLSVASRLSRRDQQTNLWLIERQVSQGNIAGALRHYDFALRTDPKIGELLFSTLTNALNDQDIRMAFAPYVRAKPPWLAAMLTYALGASEEPQNIASVITLGGGLPTESEFAAVEPMLIQKLVERAQLDAVRRYYLSTKGADPQLLTSLEMNATSTDQAKFPLTWGGTKSATVEGSFASTSKNRDGLVGVATTGERGVIGRKLLFLSPGTYQVVATRDTSGMPGDSQAILSASCLSMAGIRPIWTADLRGTKDFSPVEIEPGCTAQFFDITLDGGSGQTGAGITVSALSIRKIS